MWVCRAAALLSPRFKGAKALLEKSVCGEQPAPTTHTQPPALRKQQLPLEEARGAGVSPAAAFVMGAAQSQEVEQGQGAATATGWALPAVGLLNSGLSLDLVGVTGSTGGTGRP